MGEVIIYYRNVTMNETIQHRLKIYSPNKGKYFNVFPMFLGCKSDEVQIIVEI